MRPPIERWGITADLVPLPGGQRNLSFRTDGIGPGLELVFKSTRRAEAALRWLSTVQKIARDVGFVVPEQIESRNGHLIEDSWTCEYFVEGEHFSPDELPSALPLIAAFHEATDDIPQRPGFLSSQDLIEQDSGGDVDLQDQLRAARALLGLSQGKLAERTGLSSMTIKRAEGAGEPPPSGATIETIRSVLESAGVEFIPENGGGGWSATEEGTVAVCRR